MKRDMVTKGGHALSGKSTIGGDEGSETTFPTSRERLASQGREQRPMRTIVFLISSYSTLNTGIGGHYRSIKEIAKILQPDFRVHVYTYGNVPSPVLEGLDCYRHVETGHILRPSTWRMLRSIRQELDLSDDDEVLYIGVGDLTNYVPILFCMGLGSGPVAIVKPGGPVFNHSYMFNGVPLMVFHRQDYNRFSGCDADRPLMMAPGRVSPPPLEPDYLQMAVPKLLASEGRKLRLLTVCRIAEEKSRSMSVMYGALERQGARLENLESAHIGVQQSANVLARLKGYQLRFHHEILTDEAVVDTAARAVHACDLFIGLGRSVMEAMALGKICFVPVNDPDGTPRLVAVTRDNWKVFQNHNFTDRATMAELEAVGEPVFIEDVAGDYERWKHLGQESLAIFEENLSINTSVSAWREFYDRAVKFQSPWHQDLKRLGYFLAVTIKRQIIPIKR